MNEEVSQTHTDTFFFCNEGYIEGVGKGVRELCEWCKKVHILQGLYGKTTNGSFAA